MPHFVTAIDTNQVDEEKETKLTLKIPACGGGWGKHRVGGNALKPDLAFPC